MPRGKHEHHARASRHGRWNNQRVLSTDGYIKVRVGRQHPLSDGNGYAYEHLVVWCAAGYPRPEEGCLLHHENGDRTDNRLENLSVMDRGEHNALHNVRKQRDSSGRFMPVGRTWDEMPATAQRKD